MRVAALYDIHGNLPALEAVLDEVGREPFDEIVVGGDVFPGPMSLEALERLLALDRPVHFLRGNGERAILVLTAGGEAKAVPERHRESMRWVARQLPPERAWALATWPGTVRLEVDGVGAVLFCHATPLSDDAIVTRLTPDDRLAPEFGGVDASVVVCGHTHMQFDRTVGAVRVVNAGSVGMPFGEPGAYWLAIGPGVELRRTAYDLAAAADRIRATAYPDAEGFATGSVLHPPSEAEMLEAYRRAESRRAEATGE